MGREGKMIVKTRKIKKTRLFRCLAAAVLAVSLAGGAFLQAAAPVSVSAKTIAKPVYPKMAPYPDETAYFDASGDFDSEAFSKAHDAWFQSRRGQLDQKKGYADGLESFYAKTMHEFLSDAKDGNAIYSPLNIYLALGMLAELTANNSRKQLLDLLGCKDMKTLRAQASALWNANYCDDGAVSSILAASLWLNKDIKFKKKTLRQIADTYYASSYSGKMGSDALNRTFQNWLNKQTGGLLKDHVKQEKLEKETILALATTIYFRAKWHNEFSESSTAEGIFHAPDGDLKCDFMHQTDTKDYYWGGKFTAAAQSLENSGAMWFILPKEDASGRVTIDELLADKELAQFLAAGTSWKNCKNAEINTSVPKFDVDSKLDLRKGLKKLGVTDVFHAEKSDFSPACSNYKGVSVSQASHDARVKIDEKGCSAAAYTVISADGAGILEPKEKVDFVLDRPFLFVITGACAQPLFIGVVNQPV